MNPLDGTNQPFASIAFYPARPINTSVCRMTGFHVRRDKAALFQRVQAPPGERSSRKQPGQGMEVTKCLKPPDSGREFGDCASVQAAT